MNGRQAKAIRRAARAAQQDWLERNTTLRISRWTRLFLWVLRGLDAMGVPGCSATARRVCQSGVRFEIQMPRQNGTTRRAVAPSPRRSLLGVCSRRPPAGSFSSPGGDLQ